MYACTCTQHVHVHINTFKATKDIAAGQELFLRYSSAEWFQCKNIPRVDVDYASTMWRPDLRPLPCRQNVAQTTGEDGRHSYAVVEAVPSGTILEISLCLEVSVSVVDQFPFLRDFVLTGEPENEYSDCQDFCLLSHITCVFADQGERNTRERAEQVSYSISPFTLLQCPNP